MFKLQRLEISGFKSFADHTEIVFTGNGITAVVGPNGCGKSNVADAIAWVLGEQRAKSLRGGEMKDVVFQGTKNRKPVGMAEVVLHMVRDEDFVAADEADLDEIDEALNELDENAVNIEDIDPAAAEDVLDSEVIETNGFHGEEIGTETVQAAQVGSAQTIQTKVRTKRHWRPRSLALEFAPGEAVSVTRRLYLSGESEYQLNGKACRLRDIQDLFAGTGLSGAHYAIIEQGRIGQILSAKPADRRNLIEEAAGISKFRTRQRAAEARLETAKTNLGRVSDIVSEIDKQANSLRRQAAKTRRYKILQEDFRLLLRRLYAAEGRHFSRSAEELESQLAAAGEVEERFVAQVATSEEAARAATRSAREAEEKLAELRRLHSENALERDRAEREHRYREEQVANLKDRGDALCTEIALIEDRLKLIASELDKLAKDDLEERELLGKAELALRDAEEHQKSKVDELTAIETALEAARGELLQHTAAVERFDEVGRQLADNLQKLTERAEGLRREADRAEDAYKEFQKAAETVSADLAAEREKLAELLEEKKTVMAVSVQARAALEKADEDLRAVSDEFSNKKNRLEALRELEEKRAVYSPQVQKLFAEQTKIGVRLAGVLADRLNVEEKAERAVESLFGNYLQAVLVGSAADARKLTSWIKSNGLGRTAVLVASGSDSSKQNGARTAGSNRIADMLGLGPELTRTLRSVFPREMSAEFVEELNEGSPADAGSIRINADGDMLIGGSLYVGGKFAGNEKNTSLLAFKRELHQLETAVTKIRAAKADAESAVDSARQMLAANEEQVVDLQSLIIKVERGVHGLEIQETTSRQEIDRAERHRKVVAGEISQIGDEINEIRRRVEQSRANSTSAEAERQKTESTMSAIAAQLVEARSALDIVNIKLNERRTMAATSAERSRSAQSSLRRVENEEKELRSRLSMQKLEAADTEARIAELTGSIAEIEKKLATSSDERSREKSELDTAVEELAKARAAADEVSGELAELNKRLGDARNDRAHLEIRQAETVTHLKNLNEKCSQELGASLVELVESGDSDEDVDLDATRSEAEELRHRLDNFGAINMLALEELGETEERLHFLTSQRQDIIDSIMAAEDALREIKERSREKFRRAFTAINENFVEFFHELFGGGRGEMTLLESDDVLEAGIEVVAQPPGKRLQNILLLSGGEKAMTAIALVLAIFKFQPSPFCLLDEVDAPLDDANVGRFVNKIAEMSEKTQFIVITHNKRTMEAARALYGVTMQEPGVSKVVSVKFE